MDILISTQSFATSCKKLYETCTNINDIQNPLRTAEPFMPRGLLNCIFWRVTNIEWPGTNVRGQNIMIFYQNSSYVWSKDFQSQWKLPLLVKAINAFSHMHVLNPYKLSAIRLSFTGTSTIRFCVKNNLLLCIYIILFMSPDVLHDASWFFYHKRKQIFPIFFHLMINRPSLLCPYPVISSQASF